MKGAQWPPCWQRASSGFSSFGAFLTSSETKQITLAISQIRLDGGTQIREKLDQRVVKEYAERMRAGDVFPPVAVFFDGEIHWPADCFHCLHAARLVERATLDCQVDGAGRRR